MVRLDWARYIRWIFLLSAYLWVAQFVFFAHVQRPGTGDPRFQLAEMVSGQAHRPYVYRRLVPELSKAIASLTPDAVSQRLAAYAESRGGTLFVETKAAEETAPTLYAAAYGIALLSVLGLILVMRACLRFLYSRSSYLSDLLPVGIVLGLPSLFSVTSFEYDLPHLFLFALGAYFLMRRHWVSFHVVFAVGCVSKETMVYLLAILALVHFRRPWRSWVPHLGVGVLTAVSIRLWIASSYSESPGGAVEVHLARNLEFMAREGWKFLFTDARWIGGHAAVVPAGYTMLLTTLPLVLWKWKEKPRFLRRAVWITAMILGLVPFLGWVDEFRVLSEPYLLIMLLASHSIFVAAGHSVLEGSGQSPNVT